MFNDFLIELALAFRNTLPGENAQFTMAPQGRRNFPASKEISNAAVLILLFPVNKKPWLALMKRPEYDGVHSGQISFPGGKHEIHDKTLYHTALRETSEEFGINTGDFKYIGSLTPLQIPVSGFCVHPFVVSCQYKPEWNPDTKEVSKVIEIPISYLIDNEHVKIEIWNLHGTELEVPFYHVENEKVWGATAMIIAEFLALINTSGINFTK